MKTTHRTLSLRFLLVLTAALTLMLCPTVQATGWYDPSFAAATEWDGEEETGMTLYSQEKLVRNSDDDGSHYEYVYGLKDSAGNIVLPAKYMRIDYGGPNRLIVDVNTVIDLKGNVLYPGAKNQYVNYCKTSNTFLVEKNNSLYACGNFSVLDSNLREIGRFPKGGYVYDWGNGFFYCNLYDGTYSKHALYRIEGSTLTTVAPMSERAFLLLRNGIIEKSGFNPNSKLYDLYNEDGKRILSDMADDYSFSTERGYFIASKFKKPEYENNFTNVGFLNTSLRVDPETGDPIYCYGLISFDGEEILPFAYDKMEFTKEGVEFGNWTGERVLEKLSYGLSGSNSPTYYRYIFDTKTLTFDELNQYQPKLIDVPASAWYYDAVQWAADKSMVDGSARRLYPDANAPRSEVIEYMWKAAGRPMPTASNPFTDVSASDSYYNAVLWAYQRGITTGTSAETFAPAETCTRAQVVTFLWRAMNGAETEAKSAFADVSADAYYASPVAWAVEKGVTTGTSSTTFSPNDTCTRAQILTFLYRGYK